MPRKIPRNALIVLADGAGARFFRNVGQENEVSLSAEGEFTRSDLLDAGPAGKRPAESTQREIDEATFAKQLARELYRRAHHGDDGAVAPRGLLEHIGEVIHPLTSVRIFKRSCYEPARTSSIAHQLA